MAKLFQHKERTHVSSGSEKTINTTYLIQGNQYNIQIQVKRLDNIEDEIIEENNVTNLVTLIQCVAIAKETSWSKFEYTDCTVEIRISFADLLDKMKNQIKQNICKDINQKVLQTRKLQLSIGSGDSTESELLPKDHPLWNLTDVNITSHFATNTRYLRKELAKDIPNQVGDTLGGRGILGLVEL